MSEIGSRPYPEPWGEVQKQVAGPVWPGASEVDLADLAEAARIAGETERSHAEELYSRAARLEEHHGGGGLDEGPEALRRDAAALEANAERCEKYARIVDETATETRETKVDLSVLGAYAQNEQDTWETLLRQTAGARWVQKLAEKSLRAAQDAARSRAARAEAMFAAQLHELTAHEQDEPQTRAEAFELDGPRASQHAQRQAEGHTSAMAASAPAPEHHAHQEQQDDDQGQGDDSASTSAMAAAPLAPPPAFGAGGGHTPINYGHGERFAGGAGLSVAGASTDGGHLIDGEDPDQWLVDLARQALARVNESYRYSPYGRHGSPLYGVVPPAWLAVQSWWDSSGEARLSMTSGEGLGRWVPPGYAVPERVDFVVAARDLRERAPHTARACFERLARAEGGRVALVAVASNVVPHEEDAEHLRVTNLANADGHTREAVLVGAAEDGGSEAGGQLLHRLWHLDRAAFHTVANVPDWALGPCAVEVAAAATNAADTNRDEDDALQSVVGAWREGLAPGEGAWSGLLSTARQSWSRCADLRARLAECAPEDAGELAGDLAQPASVFSAAVALLLAPGVWQAPNAQDGRERLYDVAYELLKSGGDQGMLLAATERAAPGAQAGFVR